MLNKLFFSSIVFVFVFSCVSIGNAHDVFQDVLKEQYMLKSFACKTCHSDSHDRKLRTPFADRIYEVLKGKNLSDRFAQAVATDEEAKKKDPAAVSKDKGAVADFEKIVAKDFEEAFKVVAQQKISIEDLIHQGLLNGARLDTKAIEAANAANEE